MKELLRGVIDFGDEGILPDALTSNLQHLLASGVSWDRTDDRKILRFVKDYFEGQYEVPSIVTVRNYFERSEDVEAIERLKDIAPVQIHIRSNYSYLVRQHKEEQNSHKARVLLKEATEILTKGRTIDKERFQGVNDALSYLMRNIPELIVTESNAKTRGNIREDGQTVWDEYCEAESHKERTWGRFTGINNIDKVCRGIKKGELWIHAGFAGELKSTFAMNWCYHLCTWYRSNVYYASLEMKYEHIRRLIYTAHSANKKFELQGKKALEYRKIRDGELTPEEKAFYKEVIADFTQNPDYCSFDTWSPDRDVTVEDLRLDAELLHRQREIGMIVIDHGGLAEARRAKRNKDYVIELNSVIRDAKKLALQFNHGEGIPVLLLFQINRQGKEMADKNNGQFKMSALSYANESERSADVITTTYLNKDLREKGRTIICNLKNRDNPLFDTFEAEVDFKTRRIHSLGAFHNLEHVTVENYWDEQHKAYKDLRTQFNALDNL